MNLIIHTPHAGTLLPLRPHYNPRPAYLLRDSIAPLFRVLTDHYTDKLFSPDISLLADGYAGKWHFVNRIQQVSFPYSRLFCDVERLLDDPLEERGLGICYDLNRLHVVANYPWSMSKEIAMRLYDDHQQRLMLAVKQAYRPCVSLILDCHSFSEQDNILCTNAHEFKDIDICLGYNEDATKPLDKTISLVMDFFHLHGYRVELNTPFSNAKTTDPVWRHHSLMIEVNKHCYMDEATLNITSGFHRLHSVLQLLYEELLKPSDAQPPVHHVKVDFQKRM